MFNSTSEIRSKKIIVPFVSDPNGSLGAQLKNHDKVSKMIKTTFEIDLLVISFNELSHFLLIFVSFRYFINTFLWLIKLNMVIASAASLYVTWCSMWSSDGYYGEIFFSNLHFLLQHFNISIIASFSFNLTLCIRGYLKIFLSKAMQLLVAS